MMRERTNSEAEFIVYIVSIAISCATLMGVGIAMIVLAFTVYNPWLVLVGIGSLALGSLGGWYFYDEMAYTEDSDA